jgi:hypothetical protein
VQKEIASFVNAYEFTIKLEVDCDTPFPLLALKTRFVKYVVAIT